MSSQSLPIATVTSKDKEINNTKKKFPIYGAVERSYPVKEPIDYRLWIVELIYVNSIGKEMVLNE